MTEQNFQSLKGTQRVLWGSVALLVLVGLVAAAFSLKREAPPASPAPEIQVPKMQNVPPPDTKLGVEVEQN